MHNSYLPVIGVHAWDAWSNAPQLLADNYILLVVDLCSSLTYPTPSHSWQIAYKHFELVAKQLPTNNNYDSVINEAL